MIEKKFQEVINTIKPGEVWHNKRKGRRLTKITKPSTTIIFELSDSSIEVGVDLDDIFVLEREKVDFCKAMKALDEGNQVQSLESDIKYEYGDGFITYFNEDFYEWVSVERPFTTQEIFGKWIIL